MHFTSSPIAKLLYQYAIPRPMPSTSGDRSCRAARYCALLSNVNSDVSSKPLSFHLLPEALHSNCRSLHAPQIANQDDKSCNTVQENGSRDLRTSSKHLSRMAHLPLFLLTTHKFGPGGNGGQGNMIGGYGYGTVVKTVSKQQRFYQNLGTREQALIRHASN